MMSNGGLVMNFKVGEVLDTLKKNRAQHTKIVEEATQGYKEALRKEFVNKLHDLDSGRLPSTHSALTKPQSYVAEYDSAIEMLGMTSDATLQLDQNAFKCYVLNKWSWMGGFLSSNSMYSGTAAAAAVGGSLDPEEY